jgi:hypothetical protein
MQAPPAKCHVKRIIAPGEVLPRLFTRGHDIVVKPDGHADPINALYDVFGSPRRIGKQHYPLARLDQAAKAFQGARQRGDTVMHHAPKIENKPIVARRQYSNTPNQPDSHDAP